MKELFGRCEPFKDKANTEIPAMKSLTIIFYIPPENFRQKRCYPQACFLVFVKRVLH